MPRARVRTTKAEVDAALTVARAQDDGEMVEKAIYSREMDAVILRLRNGRCIAFAREHLQGLGEAPAAKVAKIEVLGGVGLHWEELDVDLYVPALLRGVYGSAEWMKKIGRKGGLARSEEKARAAKKNGAKGGRPRVKAA